LGATEIFPPDEARVIPKRKLAGEREGQLDVFGKGKKMASAASGGIESGRKIGGGPGEGMLRRNGVLWNLMRKALNKKGGGLKGPINRRVKNDHQGGGQGAMKRIF